MEKKIEELNGFRDLRIVDNFYQTSSFFPMPTTEIGTLSDDGTGLFQNLYNSLFETLPWEKADKYYLLEDLMSYCDAKLQVNKDYADTLKFREKCFMKTANAGKLSSDRTIIQNAKEIRYAKTTRRK